MGLKAKTPAPAPPPPPIEVPNAARTAEGADLLEEDLRRKRNARRLSFLDSDDTTTGASRGLLGGG